jgi:hypothetical protein
MPLLEVAGHEDERTVACDECSKPLYRLRAGGSRPMALSQDVKKDGFECHAPTCVTVILEFGHRWRLIFCSKECASKGILSRPEEELRGGYPLLW